MNFLNTNIVLFLFAAGIVLYTASAESPNCQQIISTTDIRTSPLSCTFNNNTCGFALSRGWKRTSSYSYHSNTIRYGKENSQFVVFDRSLPSTKSSSISSPELKPGTYCLSLWTYTTNIAGTLQIKTSSGHNVSEIKGSINSGWKQHTATVNGTTPFKIEFQYVLAKLFSRYVTIGIDNILIVQTAGIGSNKTDISCTAGETNSANGTCDFNSGRCGYTIQGHFENRTGLYSYAGNVIQQGHENSPYIVCNWDKFGVSNNNTLTSPMIQPGTYCLTFWYFVTGSSVGLSVFTTTGQSLFANISDPESTHVWTQVAVSVTEKRPFKILFQMLRAKGFFTQLQTMGIDDIRVSSHREKVCTEIVPEGTCSFKNGKTCSFRLDPPRWKVNIGEFSMGRPVFLHGQDDDSYALFETFVNINNEEEGQAYDLASPMLNPGHYCLSFWYSLPNHFSNISVITSDGVENNTIWSLEQSQKNWTEKSLQVDSRDKFQILFRSYRFSRHVGAFVGLDNIKLSKEPVQALLGITTLTERAESRTTRLPQGDTNVCQLSSDKRLIVPGGCDFNSGNCGYRFPPYLWRRHNETTGMVIFGPTDNDIGLLQSFAVFQSNDPQVKMSTVAEIASTTIVEAGDLCLKFWILMPNQNSKLEIYLVTPANNRSQLIFDYKQRLTSQWKKIELPIHVSEPFRIIFRSQKENSYGYIGLDSIQFYKEKLPTTPIPSTRTTTMTSTTTTTVASTKTTTISATTDTTTSSLKTKTTTTTSQTTYTPTTTTASTAETTTPVPTSTTTWTRKQTREPSTTTARSLATATTTPISTPTSTSTTTPLTRSTTVTMATPGASSPSSTTTTTSMQTASCTCKCPTFESKCLQTTQVPVSPIPYACQVPEMNRVKQASLSCNFDKDTCQYTIPVYPHLWERASYRYGNSNIGEIIGDQSQGHFGGYMLFNTYNNHVQSNQTQYIQTPRLSPNITHCLSFWYIMPINHSNLAIYLTNIDQSSRKKIWSIRNQVHSNWTHQYLSISDSQPFYITFQSRKESFFSFLGLDSIVISTATVQNTVKSSTPIVTPISTHGTSQVCNCHCPDIDCNAITTVPTAPPPCGDLSMSAKMPKVSCDFDERNSCGYDIPVYPHLWEMHRFIYDGEGSYLLFNTDNYHVQPGSGEEVTSPLITTTNITCLSFTYNMPTPSAILEVYQDVNGQRQLLWQQRNIKTAGWAQAEVLIPYNLYYKIVFSSSKSGLGSYFGLDDIRIYTDLKL